MTFFSRSQVEPLKKRSSDLELWPNTGRILVFFLFPQKKESMVNCVGLRTIGPFIERWWRGEGKIIEKV